MIFVTVGTHEQPFDRLVKEVDRLVEIGAIKEEVVVQYGYGTFVPPHCTAFKMLGKAEMERYYQEARIIITHGGPSSFIHAVELKKVPIVVPRKGSLNEHVNDHQLKFSLEAAQAGVPLIVLEDVSKLGETIERYGELAASKGEFVPHNEAFNDQLIDLIKGLYQ